MLIILLSVLNILFVEIQEEGHQECQTSWEADTLRVTINNVRLQSALMGQIIEPKPCFADIDKDGDQDLFVGGFDGNVHFYRNTGTSFTFVTSHLDSIDVGLHCSPTFADIDLDGDMDLFIGESDGNINFYKNQSSANEVKFVLETENFASIKVGLRSTPTFADIDNDGDLDLFVGEFLGHVNFFRNTGTPSFKQEQGIMDSIKVEFHSAPAFADIDSDGDLDLLVGQYAGQIELYCNTGTPELPKFTPVKQKLELGRKNVDSHPTFADIDNDGDLDLFVGKHDGQLLFYRNKSQASD